MVWKLTIKNVSNGVLGVAIFWQSSVFKGGDIVVFAHFAASSPVVPAFCFCCSPYFRLFDSQRSISTFLSRRHAGARALGHPGRRRHLQRLRLRRGDGRGHHLGHRRQLVEQGQGPGREGASAEGPGRGRCFWGVKCRGRNKQMQNIGGF